MPRTKSPRQELLEIQRRIYRQNQKIIEQSVLAPERAFKAYEARYLRRIRDYKKIVTPSEVLDKTLEAQIIYVGDYHTLHQSQRSLLRFLRMWLEKERKFILGMEVIQRRHQKVLDRYLAGQMSDASFLRKVGFREHWLFDLWKNFKRIFEFAAEYHIPMVGLEANPTKNPTLHQRDSFAAQVIFETAQKNPEVPIIVFMGDLHLAPQHLPKEVDRCFKKAKLLPPKTVTLYQNSVSIYWKLANLGLEHSTLGVQISENEFCRMHTPPILAQQSYLNWLEHEEGELEYADAKQTFLGYLSQIASFLGIEVPKIADEVEVFTSGDLSFLKQLTALKLFTKKEMARVKSQILKSQSYYIPQLKYVYLANVSVNHAAEEASHTLRHLCAGDEFARSITDAFYANVVHEALGFFGSLVINPKRKCLRLSDAGSLIRVFQHSPVRRTKPLELQVAVLFLEHEVWRKKKMPFPELRIRSLCDDLFMGITHAIGYALGEKMFYGLLARKLTKARVSELYADSMKPEGAPWRIYLDLERELSKIKLPPRI